MAWIAGWEDELTDGLTDQLGHISRDLAMLVINPMDLNFLLG